MDEFLIKALGLIMSLSLLVILHELGHYIPAKLFGVRVEKFYLFFDPWFSLFKVKKNGTEYGIGWLPLGGYVKLSGMIDESMDTEQMAQEPQPWDFRTKPAWQRLIIMVGGVTVNVILAIFIYSMILFTWGKSYLPAESVAFGIEPSSYMLEVGFHKGDQIIALNQVPIEKDITYNDIFLELILDDDIKFVEVMRHGETIEIGIPEDFKNEILRRKEKAPFGIRYPFVVDHIQPDSPAERAHLENGDAILTINGEPAEFYADFIKIMHKHKAETIDLVVDRKGKAVDIPVLLTSEGTIGVWRKGPDEYLDFETRNYSFLESIPAGYEETKATLVRYVRQMKLLFTKEGPSNVGGFVSIGNLFPAQWDWLVFWRLTAFLSIVLAFVNILPIPGLDGGYVLFLLYEMVSGKEPGEKFRSNAQLGGIIFLLSLMLLANGNDIWRLFSKG